MVFLEDYIVQRLFRVSLFAFVLLATISCNQQDDVYLTPAVAGGKSLYLSQKCELFALSSDSALERLTDELLHNTRSCDFVRRADDEKIKVEGFSGDEVVLIQSHIQVDLKDDMFGCDTRYVGVVVEKSGKILIGQASNGNSGCPPIQRDRKVYEIIWNRLTGRAF